MDAQDSLPIFYMMRFGAGLAVVIGAILFIYSQRMIRNREIIEPSPNMFKAGEK